MDIKDFYYMRRSKYLDVFPECFFMLERKLNKEVLHRTSTTALIIITGIDYRNYLRLVDLLSVFGYYNCHSTNYNSVIFYNKEVEVISGFSSSNCGVMMDDVLYIADNTITDVKLATSQQISDAVKYWSDLNPITMILNGENINYFFY